MKQIITLLYMVVLLGWAAPASWAGNDKPAERAQSQNGVAKLDFQLYPNPCTGKEFEVKLEGVRTKEVKITLYSVIGNIILRQTINVENGFESVHVVPQNELTKGVYFLSVEAGTEKITKRLVVNN
jgi:hypothetical protein